MLKNTLLIAAVTIITSCNKNPKKNYASFNHIGIYVSDPDKSTAFYQKLFHLNSIKAPFPGQHIKWLVMGQHEFLHLIKGVKAQIVIPPENHIAFSVAAIDPFIVLLKKENIYYEGEEGKQNTIHTRADGVKQIYLKDPDGYWIEVNTETF